MKQCIKILTYRLWLSGNYDQKDLVFVDLLHELQISYNKIILQEKICNSVFYLSKCLDIKGPVCPKNETYLPN